MCSNELFNTVELQWLEHLWNHENMFQIGVVQANECLSYGQVKRHNSDIFSIFFNMKVCCVFSLELPHYPKSAAMGLFQGTQERVQNSHGKQAISVQATEGLLY